MDAELGDAGMAADNQTHPSELCNIIVGLFIGNVEHGLPK